MTTALLGNLLGNFDGFDNVGGSILTLFTLINLALADTAILLHLEAVEIAEMGLQDNLVVNNPAITGGKKALALNLSALTSFRDDFEAESAVTAQDAIDGMLVGFRLCGFSPVAN